MDYSVFLDESFNTGEPKFNGMKWNFGNQPYFILGGYSIKNIHIDDFKKEFKQVLERYNRDLGSKTELKSTKNYKFKQDLLTDMIGLIDKYKIDVYIDISNKKYKVVMLIVEYCIYPHYMYEKNKLRSQCNFVADYIYNNVDDAILGEYINLCNGTENFKNINTFLINLEKNIKDCKIKKLIKEVIEYIYDYEDKNLSVTSLYPVKDFNNKGTVTSFLPNLDAYNNIIASKATLLFKPYNNISIYHDKQDQFSDCITKWTEIMSSKFGLENIKNIKFIDSKDEILIQFIDYITGNIRMCFNNIMNNSSKREDRELIKILKPLLSKCNIVSTNYEQDKFFNTVGINYADTPLPKLKYQVK